MNVNKFFKQYQLLIVIIVVSIFAYLPLFKAGFVNLDDNAYVFENKDVISGGFQSLIHFFTKFYVGHYLPVTMIGFKLDFLIFGFNASGYHIMNLLLHLINCWLLFELLMQMYKRRNLSVFVTFLFAIHPMHVESVAWISERKDLLYTCFILISSLFYISYIANNQKKYFVYVLLTYIIALLSKSAAVVFPILMILFDLVLKRKMEKNVVLEKLPFFALSLVFGILAIYSQDAGGKGSEAFSEFSVFERLIFILYSFGFYVIKLLLPFNLSAYYPFPHNQVTDLPMFYAAVITAIIIMIIILLQIVRYFRKSQVHPVVFGLLFYSACISLYLYLPVGRVIVADRFSYLSYIGLFISLGYLFLNYFESINSALFKRIIMVLFVIVVFGFSILTYQRARIWTNGLTLWGNVLRQFPDNPVANKSLADAFASYRNYQRAMDYYIRALTYDPAFSDAYYNMGVMNIRLNNMHQAIHDLSRTIELVPNHTDAYINRGNAKTRLNDLDGAILDFSNAIRYNPASVEAYINRGSCRFLKKDTASACIDWQMAAKAGSMEASEMLNLYCR